MSDFSSTISQLMSKWNDPNADAATRVQQKLDAVKGIIDRGEKLDIIVDKTDALADTADLFRSDAKKLKCEELKKKLRL
ncbi:vesicle-associated membrane protein [Blastocystis sp. subtype 4]|uniref:vesicle-associated membrane protein n=1 Tax=Blastocystis sp. subtype 4 TaxID=944170 RepID=UPI0007115E76|nr:vesicle-associated membrane protein [Blastocystis sp. subtype 4]KNB41362.1 vesicle-associated membrane protein [Blastocystis sp. subtype 4]|eukprot:XP_014524805.1 vesicle-associated membrane protein [Blastocystis sp. subtype 4]